MVYAAIGRKFNENRVSQSYPGIRTICISMSFFKEFCL